MRPVALPILNVLALLLCVTIAYGGDITLELSPTKVSITPKKLPRLTATIRNGSDRVITLVLPGDGSEAGLRTPITGWSFLPAQPPNRRREHPPQIPSQPPRGFSDVNPLTRSEVFTLKPGNTKSFEVWVRMSNLPTGRYRAVYYYVNDPTKRLQGYPLGPNETGAEEIMAKSTSCQLISNEIIVNVVK